MKLNKLPGRDFLKLSGIVGAGLVTWPLAGVTAAQTSDTPRRPNMLVFLTDDRGQWAQHARQLRVAMPNLGRLMARGTRMARVSCCLEASLTMDEIRVYPNGYGFMLSRV